MYGTLSHFFLITPILPLTNVYKTQLKLNIPKDIIKIVFQIGTTESIQNSCSNMEGRKKLLTLR